MRLAAIKDYHSSERKSNSSCSRIKSTLSIKLRDVTTSQTAGVALSPLWAVSSIRRGATAKGAQAPSGYSLPRMHPTSCPQLLPPSR